MADKITHLLYRYRVIILYLFFGVCTTLVNILTYYLCAYVVPLETMPSTILAWLAAVIFAYLTNRKWVFESSETAPVGILRELFRFISCRIATGVVDWLCMFVFVDIFAWNDMLIKVAANILVIILNYIASKLVIFKQKDGAKKNT